MDWQLLVTMVIVVGAFSVVLFRLVRMITRKTDGSTGCSSGCTSCSVHHHKPQSKQFRGRVQ